MRGAVAIIVVCIVPELWAAPVTYHFTGQITHNASNGFSEAGLPSITVGDPFTGRFVYDDATPDSSPHPAIGKFTMDGPPTSLIEVTVNGLTFSSIDPTTISTNNDIFNRDSFSPLSLGVSLPAGWSIPNAALTDAASVAFVDATQTAFDSDALPELLRLSDFNVEQVRFSFQDSIVGSVSLNHPGGSNVYVQDVTFIGAFQTLLREGFVTGDFDGSGIYDCADVDPLVGVIASGSHDLSFDLTGDGNVDAADLMAWLSEAGANNLPSGAAYLPGDADLNGTVDGSDFNIWNANKFTLQPMWCAGDFNADGGIDGHDFLLWNSHKFSTTANLVPEPAGNMPLALAVILYSTTRYRRRWTYLHAQTV